MIKVDLITGFLGAGKTTFLKKYATYLMNQGIRVGILENDYGAVNVDMLMLQELRGERCEVEMVAGGCDADCHRRRFKTKLIAMGMSGYDRVIIEPSGIFDVDEFFDSLHEEPLDRWYEIGNVITIVDAKLSDDFSEQADYFLASQIANAGCVLLSRTQLATEEEVKRTVAHLKRAAGQLKCRRPVEDILMAKDWDAFTGEDYEKLLCCGYQMASYLKKSVSTAPDYSTLYFLEIPFDETSLREKTERLFADEEYGEVFRVKGFFCEDSGKWYEVNATKEEMNISPIPVGQEVVIVIGQGLDEERIGNLMRA